MGTSFLRISETQPTYTHTHFFFAIFHFKGVPSLFEHPIFNTSKEKGKNIFFGKIWKWKKLFYDSIYHSHLSKAKCETLLRQRRRYRNVRNGSAKTRQGCQIVRLPDCQVTRLSKNNRPKLVIRGF